MIEVAPHELQRIGDLWDSLSRPLMFRAFTLGKSGFMGRPPGIKDQDKARRDQKAVMLLAFECELIDWIHFASFKAGTDNAALEWAVTTGRSDLASADRKHLSPTPMHRLVGLIYPRVESRPDVAQGYETACQFLLD